MFRSNTEPPPSKQPPAAAALVAASPAAAVPAPSTVNSVVESASGYFSGFKKWATTATTASPAPIKQKQVQQKPAPRKIEWGVLGEPELQKLVREQICNDEPSKIQVMYNWLGHVLDGQPRNVLPSKGVEMKKIPMVVCGTFLDRALPFLNSKCHPDCVVEAYYVPSPPPGEKANWNVNSRMWMPEQIKETPRERASTLEVLLRNAEEELDDKKDEGENSGGTKWQRRFSLQESQTLGSVHIRIGLEAKLGK